MILRAAKCAEDLNARPPYPLKIKWQCDEYGALPYTGGAMDQPAKLMHDMMTLSNVWKVWDAYMRAPRKAMWAEQNPRAWRMCQDIIRLRRKYG